MGTVDILGIINLIFGCILLFFGARFVRLTVGAYGGLLGLFVGSLVASGLSINDMLKLAIIVACVVVMAIIAVTFYKFLIRASIGLFAFNLTYAMVHQTTMESWLAVLISVAVAVIVFILVKVLKLVDIFFIMVTSLQGAATVISASVILFTTQDSDALRRGDISSLVQQSTLWLLGWLALAIIGMVVQKVSTSHKDHRSLDAE